MGIRDKVQNAAERRLTEAEAKRDEENTTLGRTSAEIRELILVMFKKANAKYAKPFEGDRLADLSVMGGNWSEHSQVVLQMAILDTLLSIEEKLTRLAGEQPAG